MTTDPHPPRRELSVAEAYALLYGREASEDVIAMMHSVVPGGSVACIADLRRMVMRLDRQTYPTSAIFRFNEDDLDYVEVEGFSLAIDKADLSVSAGIASQRTYEPHLSGLFRRYLKDGWRVADIGANVGYFSMLARSCIGASGEVLSFDPNSENCRLILLSSRRNGFQNIRLFPFALSDRAGYAYFSSAIGSNGGLIAAKQEQLAAGMGLVVPTARLDDLIQPPLDFMKLDTEGSEYRILRGSQGLLSSCRPIISTEFSLEMISRVSDADPRDYLSLFLRFGYSLNIVNQASGRLEPIADIDAFLSAWGSLTRIEDLIALPAGTPILQPA